MGTGPVPSFAVLMTPPYNKWLVDDLGNQDPRKTEPIICSEVPVFGKEFFSR
jgi:hypothetical protein